jgi:hypothetical protein
MDIEIELFESPDLTLLDFCLWCWMKSEVYKRKVGTRDESLARILDAVARINKAENQLRLKKTRSSAQDLLSPLRLTVGFSNI